MDCGNSYRQPARPHFVEGFARADWRVRHGENLGVTSSGEMSRYRHPGRSTLDLGDGLQSERLFDELADLDTLVELNRVDVSATVTLLPELPNDVRRLLTNCWCDIEATLPMVNDYHA